MRRRARLLPIVLLAAAGCSTNPATGKPTFSLISERQEIEMGRQAAADVARSIGLYDDARSRQLVETLGMELAKRSERPGLPWSFQVVDDPMVNAFALPGGLIFVTRGLLTHMQSEAQLAAVIGHEIGHVTARHQVQMISKAQIAQLGLAAGMIFSDTLRELGQLGAAGLSLLFLKYGRDAEREADDLGYRYMSRDGFDVHAMPAVFGTLKRVSEASGQQRLPGWLLTHPSPDERIDRIEEVIAETDPPVGKILENEYLRATDGMVFGQDPRQGFFEDHVFKHPALRFQVALPADWKAQNLAQALVAASPQQDAVFQLTLAEGSPEQALQRFATNKAVSAVERADAPVRGLPAASARFVAQTSEGRLAGLVTFVAHGGKTYQLLGITPPEQLAATEPRLRAIEGSFAPLTDPRALAAQPARIQILTVDRPMTLAELNARKPSTIPIERLAIVNQMQPDTRLPRGKLVKLVVGGFPAEAVLPPVAAN